MRVALVAKDGEDPRHRQQPTPTAASTSPSALLDGEGAQHAKMVMAYGPQGDFTALDLDRSPVDLSKQDVGGRTPGAAPQTARRPTPPRVDGYLYADRGIYRPGETVHLVALVRDRLAKAVKDRKGALVIRRPSGVEFQRVRFDAAPTTARWPRTSILPKSAPRGQWTADAGDGRHRRRRPASVSFQVEDFAPAAAGRDRRPATPARRVGPAETRKVDVTARFLYGATGSGLQTQGEARIRADPDPFPALKDYQLGRRSRRPSTRSSSTWAPPSPTAQGHATLQRRRGQGGRHHQPAGRRRHRLGVRAGRPPVRESADLKVRTKPLYLGVKTDLVRHGRYAHPDASTSWRWTPAARASPRPASSYTPDRGELELRLVPAGRPLEWRRTSRDKPSWPGRAQHRRRRARAPDPPPAAGATTGWSWRTRPRAPGR